MGTLRNLSNLSIYTVPLALDAAFTAVASWSSPLKYSPGSTLILTVQIEECNVDLLHRFLVFGSIRPAIVGSSDDAGTAFTGDLFVLMKTVFSIERLRQDIDTIDTLLCNLRYDPQVKARVFPVCTLFNDAYDMHLCKYHVILCLSLTDVGVVRDILESIA